MWSPTSSLVSASGGARRSRMLEVLPTTSAIGASFQNTIRFQYQADSNLYMNASESYVSIAFQAFAGDGVTPLTVNSDIGFVRAAPAFLWQTMELRLGGQQVELLTDPAAVAVTTISLTKSSAWAETAGSAQLLQRAFADRQEPIIDANTADIQWHPQFATFGVDKLIRGCPLQMNLSVSPNWRERIIESVVAPKVSGTDYVISVVDIRLWLSLYEPEQGVAPDFIAEDIIDCQAVEFQQSFITAQNAVNYQISVRPTTFMAVGTFRETNQGTDTTLPLFNVGNADTTSIQFIWDGVSLPESTLSTNFTTQSGLYRSYVEMYLKASVADSNQAGSLLSFAEWSSDTTLFAQKLLKPASSHSDQLTLKQTFGSAQTGSIVLTTVAPLRIVLKYSSTGIVNNAMATYTANELGSALA